ncbi:hypothetical protein V5799_031431, partial [Amblyomma americanum]
MIKSSRKKFALNFLERSERRVGHACCFLRCVQAAAVAQWSKPQVVEISGALHYGVPHRLSRSGTLNPNKSQIKCCQYLHLLKRLLSNQSAPFFVFWKRDFLLLSE